MSEPAREELDRLHVVHELSLTLGFRGEVLYADARLSCERRESAASPWLTEKDAVLCHGEAVLWESSRDEGWEQEALAWLLAKPTRAAPDPADIAASAGEWGWTVGGILGSAAGEETIDWLTERSRDPGTLARIVFRALDDPAAMIPVETALWPPGADGKLLVDGDKESPGTSIVRLPRCRRTTPRSPSGFPREPGLLRILKLRGSDIESARTTVIPAAPADSVLSGQTSVTETDLAAGIGQDDVRSFDLAVVSAHSVPGVGAIFADGTEVSSHALGKTLAAGPLALFLALCGSATGRRGAKGVAPSASTAEACAVHGAPLTIGFQGNEIADRKAEGFVRGCLEEMGESLHRQLPADEASRVWELATRRARRGLLEPFMPVLFVAPTAFEHAGDVNRPRRRKSRLAMRSAYATCFGCPGQVVCFADPEDPERLLRVPLAVDTGVQLIASLHVDQGSGVGLRTLTAGRIGAVRDAWGLPRDVGITVRATGDRPRGTDAWAWQSAELSALLRAVSAVTREPVPPAAMMLLHESVASDWGAIDGECRAVEISSGAPVVRFGKWPALDVRPLHYHEDVGKPSSFGPSVPWLRAAPAAREVGLALARSQTKAFVHAARSDSQLSSEPAKQDTVEVRVPARATLAERVGDDARPKISGLVVSSPPSGGIAAADDIYALT